MIVTVSLQTFDRIVTFKIILFNYLSQQIIIIWHLL